MSVWTKKIDCFRLAHFCYKNHLISISIMYVYSESHNVYCYISKKKTVNLGVVRLSIAAAISYFGVIFIFFVRLVINSIAHRIRSTMPFANTTDIPLHYASREWCRLFLWLFSTRCSSWRMVAYYDHGHYQESMSWILIFEYPKTYWNY